MRTNHPVAVILAILAVSVMTLAVPGIAQPDGQAAKGWQIEITPYFWLTGIAGDIRAGESSAAIDVSFSEIMNSLDFGLMGMVQIRKGRVGFLIDAMYAKLSRDGEISGTAGQEVHIDFLTQLYSFAMAYRAFEVLDIVGGVRVMPGSAELEVTSGILEGAEASGSNTSVDGYLGVRLEVPLSGRLAIEAYTDVGTGSSKLTWQTVGGLKIKLSKSLSGKLGYRLLSLNNETADLQTKFVEGGFYFGLGIRL